MGTAKIIVCTHKPGFVLDNDLFMPLQVGKAVSGTDLGFQGDDTGDNISLKNSNYCELTGMYWAWKNLRDVDYIGLAHYRRYFRFQGIEKWKNVEDGQTVSANPVKELSGYDVILPSPWWMEQSVADAYIYAHVMEDFYIMNRVVLRHYPDYEKTMVDFFFRSNKWIGYNMFFSSWSWFDGYCRWLFPLLFEVEKYVRISNYSYQRRIFGFMAELLLPLYCLHNHYRIRHLPILSVDEAGRLCKMVNMKSHLLEIRNTLKFKMNCPRKKNIDCKGRKCHVNDCLKIDHINI